MEIKKNLRNFSGWDFKDDSDQHRKKMAALERLVTLQPVVDNFLLLFLLLLRYSVGGLKVVAQQLGLPRSGTKVSGGVEEGAIMPTPHKYRTI